MAQVTVYNPKGEKTESMTLSDAVFAVKPKGSVIHQVYISLEANTREPWADTKNRGEVSGGGKKPWKQKGTGRARHGSIRSPIWRGGGITFGPLTVRNYKQKVNKKMNQLAVKMCLTGKVQGEQFVVLNAFESNGKTKEMAALREILPGAGRSTLIILENQNENVLRATRNIPAVHVTRAEDVNVADLLHHQYIVTSRAGVQALEKRLS